MWSKTSSVPNPQDGNESDQDAHLTRQPSPDPLCANAATFNTQVGVHSRTASLEEDIISSLRTQLALQKELCAQFEIDLRARDELVEALTIRLEASEKENDKRRNVVRSWKQKAAFLERMCCHLEEEKRNSLVQTVESSNRLEQEISRLRANIQQLQKDSAAMEVTIAQLNKQRDQDKEDIGGLNIALESKQQELELVKRKHGVRGAAGLASGRTNAAPPTGKPVGNTVEEKENDSIPVSLKPPRRIVVPP